MLRHLGACKTRWRACGHGVKWRVQTRHQISVQPAGVLESTNSSAHQAVPLVSYSGTEQDDSGEEGPLPSRQRSGIKKSTVASYEVCPSAASTS
jgi:hypothetical protein